MSGDGGGTPKQGVMQAGTGDFFSAGDAAVIDADPDQVEQRFGRGRPKGAGNLVNKQIAAMCARIMGDDRLALARIVATPTDVLRRELVCSKLEAEQFKLAVRRQLWPYVYAEMPKELAINTKSAALHLHLGATGSGPAATMQSIEEMFRAGEAEAQAEGFALLPAKRENTGETEG